MAWLIGSTRSHGVLHRASCQNAAALGCIYRMQEETTLGAEKAMPVGPGSAEREKHVGSARAARRSRAFKMSQNCSLRVHRHVCSVEAAVLSACCEVNCSSAKWGVLAAIARVVGEDGEYDYEAGRF